MLLYKRKSVNCLLSIAVMFFKFFFLWDTIRNGEWHIREKRWTSENLNAILKAQNSLSLVCNPQAGLVHFCLLGVPELFPARFVVFK